MIHPGHLRAGGDRVHVVPRVLAQPHHEALLHHLHPHRAVRHPRRRPPRGPQTGGRRSIACE